MYDDTALRRLLIELAASHPEHAAVIRAFTPLALARGKLLDAYALSRKTKPLDGFPMFRFEELPVCSEKSGAIASAVLEAVAEGFPGAREQVEAVRDALRGCAAGKSSTEAISRARSILRDSAPSGR